MQPFPQPDSPNDVFWTMQKARYREDAKDEYLRLLAVARRLGNLTVKVISHPLRPTVYDVQYMLPVNAANASRIRFETMSILAFIKREAADRFIEIAMSDFEIPDRPSQRKKLS